MQLLCPLATPMVLHLLLLFTIHLRPTSAASTANTTTLPGCPDSCGNITIPYPFGLTPGCFANGFGLTCNDSYDPPKLFLGNGNVEVTNLSLEHVIMRGVIARDCFDEPLTDNYRYTDLKASPYTFSYARNKFTAIGCDTVALIYRLVSTFYSSGCMSLCRNAESVVNGSCGGIGCCQTAIPKGLKRFDTNLQNFSNHSRTWSFSPCSYAFLIDAEEYEFKISDFYSFHERQGVPVVLDWAVGNQTCAEARRDRNFLCGARSKCLESANGPGYRCSCIDGHQGNPYLSDGCQGNLV